MDYYSLLEIDRSATAEQIKAAYRKLAKKYHPDVNQGDQESEEKFKQISEAYSVLSDPDKKQNYDRFGSAEPQNPFQGGHNFDFDPSSIFEEFFGRRHNSQVRGNLHLQVAIKVPLKDFIVGADKNVQYSRMRTCKTCSGAGGSNPSTCNKCGGTGIITISHNLGIAMMQQHVSCDLCGGKGKVIQNQCSTCHGVGFNSENTTCTIKIPTNCSPGTTITLKGEGHQQDARYPAGDLIIVIEPDLKKDEGITHEGHFLTTQEISIENWYNNNTIKIDRFGIEKLDYNLKDLKTSDQEAIFRGKGFKSPYSANSNADFVVKFKIIK